MPLLSCPVCDGPPQDVALLQDVPVFCNVLHPTADAARDAATADIRLVACERCAMVWNADFDAALARYAPGYENSLHASATFATFSDQLARRLVDEHYLTGRSAVEIGPGDGRFLESLVDAGMACGTGFDPSHRPGADRQLDPRVEIRAEPFPDDGALGADLVCARHVLEHLERPGDLMRSVAKALAARDGAVLYVEVPDGRYMVTRPAVWDVIYEHPLYFAAPAMTRLLQDAGLDVMSCSAVFGGQYLAAEAACRDAVHDAPSRDDVAMLEQLGDALDRFATEINGAVDEWDERVRAAAEQGPVAVWGAGSKGVTFCNRVPAARHVRWVVDLNPRKHGRFLPGAALEVSGPPDLVRDPPRTVIVMNPLYVDEIRDTLRVLGLDPQLLVV